METLSGRLATIAVERLMQEKLLTDSEAMKLLPKLADGTMRPEDWRLALENSDLKQNGR